MNILIVGARGFLGGHLAATLLARGHHVRCVARTPPGPLAPPSGQATWVAADFATDLTEGDWLPHLAGIDAVVNTAGIFREGPGSSFESVHIRGPAALFGACATRQIHRAVQVSAVGADAHAESAYHLSKREGDAAVLVTLASASVAQPSLVFGPDGASSRLFLAWASLPLIPVPAGTQWVQPIHVDDVTEALVTLVETIGHEGQRVALVGPQPLTWRDYLAALRQGLGLGPARFLPIPQPLVALAARLAGMVRGSLFDPESWRMLQRGNTADPSAVSRLLGRAPRAPQAFVPDALREPLRQRARLDTLLPMMRILLASVWLVTAVVSLGVYPVEDSLALLARVGLEGDLARLALLGAAGTDFALGLATLCWSGRRLWWAQMALIGFYTFMISIWLPEYWAHPYGPVLKNLPILGVLVLLLSFEERR